MQQMARESRGGVEVDGHLNKEKDDPESKIDENESNVDESGRVTNVDNDAIMTESSAADQVEDDPKTNELPETKEDDNSDKEEGNAVQKAPTGKIGHHHNKNKKKNGDLGNEDFIPLDESIWPPILDQFGLGPDFPKEQYMARASGEAKVLYFISKSIKEELIDRGIQNRVTVINSGLKAFERCSIQDARAKYRISQEGVQFVVPHMTKRLLVVSAEDFYKCVSGGFIEFNIFSEEFRGKIDEMDTGSFVVALEGHDHDLGKKMFLVMWKRKNALECFVAKVEMDGIKSKLRALGLAAPEEESKENGSAAVE
jgi:hypothetical protein